MERLIGRLEEFQKQAERRFDQIERKIDSLSEFKWKFAGGALVVGTILTGLIELMRG